MYVVGTDRIRITDGRVEPADDRHAVDADGQVSCRDRGASYTFPALSWSVDDATDDRCPACVQVVLARQEPSAAESYPTDDAADVLVPDSLGF
jgi:hypothetical protein